MSSNNSSTTAPTSFFTRENCPPGFVKLTSAVTQESFVRVSAVSSLTFDPRASEVHIRTDANTFQRPSTQAQVTAFLALLGEGAVGPIAPASTGGAVNLAVVAAAPVAPPKPEPKPFSAAACARYMQMYNTGLPSCEEFSKGLLGKMERASRLEALELLNHPDRPHEMRVHALILAGVFSKELYIDTHYILGRLQDLVQYCGPNEALAKYVREESMARDPSETAAMMRQHNLPGIAKGIDEKNGAWFLRFQVVTRD